MDLTRRSALVLGAAAATAALTPHSASAHPATGNPFVTRAGTRLRLGDRPFRFAGTNIYWLGLDENVGGVGYPTCFRIRDALDTATVMGCTVVRSHMMASTGNPLSILPSKDAGFNDAAFATVDYAIAHAGAIGVRLILPLTDEWSYYHGAHRDFTNPYELPSEAFYTDPRVVADYQAYVSHVMHRVNPLTGVAYHQDPTIMAWEFGNELEGMPLDWLNANAAQFRRWAPRQLIAAGRRFDIDPDTLAAPDVDLVDVHYYPPTVARVRADAATVTAAGKVYIGGEYASTAASTDLLTPLAADPDVTGMLSWSLFGHHDRAGFVAHDDGFTMHYPGDDARMRAAVDAQIAFAAAMSPPARRLVVGPPLITEIGKRGGLDVVRWRGAAGAAGYRVERSRRERGPWTAAHQGLLTDRDAPWTDPVPSGDVWYRVVPVDRMGRAGTSADPVSAGASEVVLVDPLEDFTLTSTHMAVVVTPADGFAVVRPSGAGAFVSWTRPGIRVARFDVVTAGRRPAVTVEVSADGVAWRPARTQVSPGVRRYTVTATTTAAAHIRLVWPPASTTGLVRATLRCADPAPVTAPPAAPALSAPAAGAAGVIGPAAFTWTAAAGAGLYTLTVSRQADLGNPVLTVTGLVDPTHVPAAALPPATTYFWRVGAVNARGTTHSGTATFTTRAVPTSPVTIDDFDGYADAAALAAAYPRNTGGDPITPTLIPAAGGGRAMRLDFSLATAGYAGVSRTFTNPLDVWGQAGIECHLDRTGTTAGITVQFVTSGVYWEHTLPAGAGAGVVRIPFSEFKHPSWAPSGPLDLLHLGQLSIYVGGSGAGTLIVDGLVAYPAGL